MPTYEVEDPQYGYDDVGTPPPAVTQAEVHIAAGGAPEEPGTEDYLVPGQDDWTTCESVGTKANDLDWQGKKKKSSFNVAFFVLFCFFCFLFFFAKWEKKRLGRFGRFKFLYENASFNFSSERIWSNIL